MVDAESAGNEGREDPKVDKEMEKRDCTEMAYSVCTDAYDVSETRVRTLREARRIARDHAKRSRRYTYVYRVYDSWDSDGVHSDNFVRLSRHGRVDS
jgi:hypothetical protein